ncbi:hypothetical protein [Nonomuraea cypriaca]|uniref:hypothetical protein n=1 Tax=Nonomuraea cypriaca TaxID=1187855 RepID=UPI001A9C64E3|nr:hypothetical protein [Nonomuraea cypriaca]
MLLRFPGGSVPKSSISAAISGFQARMSKRWLISMAGSGDRSSTSRASGPTSSVAGGCLDALCPARSNR